MPRDYSADVGRAVAGNKKPQPKLGASRGSQVTQAEEEETARDASVGLYLWLKYAEPAKTLGNFRN